MKRVDSFSQKAKSTAKWLPMPGIIGLSLFPIRLWVRQALLLVTMLWSIIAIYME